MLWNIDGQEIEILTKADGMIEVVHWSESRKAVCLPAQLSREEAVWSLRNLLEQERESKLEIKMGSMTLFDRVWPVRHDERLHQPFLKNNIIYCNIKGRAITTAAENTIKAALLSQWVMHYVGRWEEHFGKLIPQVTFRKNKKAAFTIHLAEGMIRFDKDLLRFQLPLIDYTVFLAICEYLQVDLATVAVVRDKHFPSARLFDKILTYEYDKRDQTNDSDYR